VRLDGRREIGYAEYGPVTGRPLLWFHGTPGARRQIAPEMREAAFERGVRLIAVERPGIGDSTPYLYTAVVDWAADVELLCDALGLGRFAVAGLSGGGPYPLACAHEMPERVVAAAVLGGVAPAVGEDAADGGLTSLTRFLSPVFRRRYPRSGVRLRRLVRWIASYADQATDLFASFMTPGDQRLFADPAVREMFQDDLITGRVHGTRSRPAPVVISAVAKCLRRTPGRTWRSKRRSSYVDAVLGLVLDSSRSTAR
jgi:pimeloyl-ACP methyl ester carboxylesterase